MMDLSELSTRTMSNSIVDPDMIPLDNRSLLGRTADDIPSSMIFPNVGLKKSGPSPKKRPRKRSKDVSFNQKINPTSEVDIKYRMPSSIIKCDVNAGVYDSDNDEDTDDVYNTSCDELEENDKRHRKRRRNDNFLEEVSTDEKSDLLKDILFKKPTTTTTKKPRRKTGMYSMNCFGCMWTSSNQDSINVNHMNACLRIIDENYGRMDNAALSKSVHLYFKHNIYLPMKKRGKNIKIWRTGTIKEHIEKHTLDPRIFVGETIREYKEYLEAIKRMSFAHIVYKEDSLDFEDPHSIPPPKMRLVLMERNIKCLMDMEKRVTELYKLNPKNLNFYNDDCKINFDSIGKMINMNRNWTIDQSDSDDGDDDDDDGRESSSSSSSDESIDYGDNDTSHSWHVD